MKSSGQSRHAAAAPHLGVYILACVVSVVLSPTFAEVEDDDEDGQRHEEEDDEDSPKHQARELRCNLRLACRQLRDLVDAEWGEAHINVAREDAAAPAPLDEDCARLLGRLERLSTVRIWTCDVWDDHDKQLLLDAAVVRVLLAGLPQALPNGGTRRITKLTLYPDGAPLIPSTASAVGAALPSLQHLSCTLPDSDSWSGRALGTAVLNNLPATLQSLVVDGGAMGTDGGEAITCLTALTQLSFQVSDIGSGICRHVAHLSELRSLSLGLGKESPSGAGRDFFPVTYHTADVAALTTLAHLTRLRARLPFVAEHLPLGHLTALQELRACTADLPAFTAALATPSLDRLQELHLDLHRSLAASRRPTGTSEAAPAGGPAPLLPSLRVLDCALDVRCPSFDHLPQLLRRLASPGDLRRLHLGRLSPPSDDNYQTATVAAATGANNARQVLYPQLAPALTLFTALQSLKWELSGGQDVPAGGTFADIVRAMPRLREVYIGLGEVDIDSVTAAIKGGRNIRRATARPQQGRAWLTDEALEALASRPNSQLQRFEMSGAAHVTRAAVQALARLPRLRVLKVSHCPKVPPEQEKALWWACRHPDEEDIQVE